MIDERHANRAIRVVTLCSGYDAQCLALERLRRNYSDFDYELIAWAEIDEYAIQAHNALFPKYKDRNMGDITSCDWGKIGQSVDLLTYSTPCTDVSNAGKQRGMKEGSGTASSIIWSVLNAIDALKPKYLLMENVKALVSSKFIGDFQEWQDELVKRGYTNFAKVLNAKDYCIPQNRERIFMVSILGDNARFNFPKPFPLEKRLKDILEQEVDERFFLSEERVQGMLKENEKEASRGNGFCFRPKMKDDVANTIRTREGTRKCDNYIIEPKILSYTRDDKGKVVNRHFKDVANTIHGGTGGGGNTDSFVVGQNYRIRKLTPRECFRLQDVDDEDINKLLNSGISNTQLYKMARNSITVSPLYHIFRKIFVDKENENKQLTLF